MKRGRLLLRLLIGIVGILSGLPFRKTAQSVDVQHSPVSSTAASKANDRPGNVKSPEHRAIEVFTTRDPGVLKRAWNASLEKSLDTLDPAPALIWIIADRWAKIDPQGMFDHLIAQGGMSYKTVGSGSLYNFSTVLFAAWVIQDREAAIRAALDLKRHAQYSDKNGLEAVMAHLIETDDARAQQLINAHPDDVFPALTGHFQSSSDKTRFMDLVAGITSTQSQKMALHELVRKWIADKDNSAQAGAWITRQPEPLQNSILNMVSTYDIETLPDGILDLFAAQAEKNPEIAAEFTRTHGAKLIEMRGFTEALQWASQSLRGEPRHQAMQHLLEETDAVPLDDLVEAFDTLPGGTLRDSTATVIAGRMAELDPPGTLEWINAQGIIGRARAKLIEKWAYGWAARDKDAVVEFLNTTEPTSDSDILVEQASRFFSQYSNTKTVAWIEKLTNEHHAATLASRAFREWAVNGKVEDVHTAAETLQLPAVKTAALAAIKEGLEARTEKERR
ncbi:MAG: hypothetical protein ACI9R3_004751 [Verrucomicrobiales bacterium]|jgi:hypothetical protein